MPTAKRRANRPTPAGVDSHDLFPIKHKKNVSWACFDPQASVIVKVLRSGESSICQVPVILPFNLYVISRLRSFTLRPE